MQSCKFLARLVKFSLGIFVLSLICGGLQISAADRASGAAALGLLSSKGSVWVDHALAPAAATSLFPNEVVRTGEDSIALIGLDSGTVTLTGNGELLLPPSARTGEFELRRGAMLVTSAAGAMVRVNVLGTSVRVQGRQGFPALCRIAVAGKSAAIFNDRGDVTVREGGAPFGLAPGRLLQVQAGSQAGAPQQEAGTVNNEIPEETIQREGQGPEAPLPMHGVVNWQDVVRTLQTGRVRIQLLDGSFLNIGARSVMRIVRQVPQAQQTQILFTLGRMRATVVKLTKPGASFKVQTQTAVIGVVGTIFIVEAFPNFTRVLCLRGIVTVWNINPAIIKTVRLHAGQWTTVSRGMPPTIPHAAPTADMQSALSQTNIAPGTGITQAGAIYSSIYNGGQTLNLATLGLIGSSAALSGIGLSKIADANSTLQSATNAANNAMNQANAAAGAATTAAGTAGSILSIAKPICGCP